MLKRKRMTTFQDWWPTLSLTLVGCTTLFDGLVWTSTLFSLFAIFALGKPLGKMLVGPVPVPRRKPNPGVWNGGRFHPGDAEEPLTLYTKQEPKV